jgi:hypothetical protein
VNGALGLCYVDTYCNDRFSTINLVEQCAQTAAGGLWQMDKDEFQLNYLKAISQSTKFRVFGENVPLSKLNLVRYAQHRNSPI